MAKVAIVYWSGSGNTEAMAQAIENAAKDAGAETTLSFVSDTTASDVAAFDHIILGCPAMGNEELEEYEFEPFFAELLPQLKGKIVGIFGSYAWNQGDWIATIPQHFQLAEAIFNSNSAAALAAVDEILEHGFSLIDHSRQK